MSIYIGQKIKELREKKGLSQDELADKIKVTGSSISLWELGSTNPKGKNLIKLASFFGVDADSLRDKNLPKLDKEGEVDNNEYSKDFLLRENIRLHRKLEVLLEQALKAEKEDGGKKDIIIELQGEIKRLQEELNKKRA